MKKVLITGGAGFIGSHLTNKLRELNHQVHVVDNLSNGKLNNLNSKINFYKGDISNVKALNLIQKIKPDVIFHLAAQSSISKSYKYPADDIKINLIATQKLISAANLVNVKKIIFASSAAVYGKSKKLPIQEESSKNPISIYGITKLASEHLFKVNSLSKKIPYVNLRYANIYGPNQDSSAEGGVVSIFIKKTLRENTIHINGDGNQTRDFIYVSDVVEANIKALNENVIGDYNIGTAKETSINNLYKQISSIINKKIKKAYNKVSFQEVERSSLSSKKFQSVTNWKAKESLKDGLIKTIDYFKNK